MKKLVSIFVILTLTFSLVACNNNKANENNNTNVQNENIQNENDENVFNNDVQNNDMPNKVDDEVDIKGMYSIDEGMNVYSKSLTIRLHDTAETEYSWYLSVENDGAIVKVEDFGKQGIEDVFKFTGVSKGEKYLTFRYMKSSEDEDYEKLVTFVFDVNENGEIAVKMVGI